MPAKNVNQLIQKIKISDAPTGEIVTEITWVSILYYASGTAVLMQVRLILDGIRGQFEYPIKSSQFWVTYVFVSVIAFIIGAVIGSIIGLIHGSFISAIYRLKLKISSTPSQFKFTVYFVHLLIPTLISLFLLLDTIKHPFGNSIENLGLVTLALGATTFLISHRVWRWWSRDAEMID